MYLSRRRKPKRMARHVLISDGFGTHESANYLRFAFENDIRLLRLSSHTSHKTQPCHVGPFGPLKAAYRYEAEQLFSGGSNMIRKQRFTLLYEWARHEAFTPKNIMSDWTKAGLFPSTQKESSAISPKHKSKRVFKILLIYLETSPVTCCRRL
jgi:hypothetical protein